MSLLALSPLKGARPWWTDITGMRALFDGNDPDGNGVAPSNGSAITTWVNKGSISTTMTQASSTRRPTYATNAINGLGVVRFSRSPNVQFLADSANGAIMPSTGAFTVIWLAKLASLSGAYAYAFTLYSPSTTAPALFYSSSATYNDFLWGAQSGWANLNCASSISPLTGSFHSIEYAYNGSGKTTAGNFSCRTNGTTRTLTSGGGEGPHTNTNIIGEGATNLTGVSFAGDLAAFVIYDHVLTTGEQAIVDQIRSQVYGL